jgi:hypothetical protein
MNHLGYLILGLGDNTRMIVPDITSSETGEEIEVTTAISAIYIASLSTINRKVRPIICQAGSKQTIYIIKQRIIGLASFFHGCLIKKCKGFLNN